MLDITDFLPFFTDVAEVDKASHRHHADEARKTTMLRMIWMMIRNEAGKFLIDRD